MLVELIGATGNVGSRVPPELVEFVRRGHRVTAVTRNPGRGPAQPGFVPKHATILYQYGLAQYYREDPGISFEI